MDITLQQFVAIVQSQDFPHKNEFLSTVAAGRCVIRRLHGTDDVSTADATELLDTYRLRQAHLAQSHSAHAQALTSDVAWFCANMETTPPGRVSIWVVETTPPYHLNFFLDAETNKVLGCMKTVSQLDVTLGEWERLWAEE